MLEHALVDGDDRRSVDRRGRVVAVAHLVPGRGFALPEEGEARTVVHGNIASTVYVDVDDPGILRDIDTKADL